MLAPLAQTISFLPTSLQYLSVMCGPLGGKPFGDTIISLVCRCGPSLRSFKTSAPLSEAATNHIMRLPNISHWTVTQEPPRVVPTFILPSLESIWLDEPEALLWLHLLASHERSVPRNDSVSATQHTYIRERLKFFECTRTIVDSTFLSSAVEFKNLVRLNVHAGCYDTEYCIFRLTDDDMENLAASLPRLVDLRLGGPCRSTSCNTTVASLLSISVRCLDLTVLETHFNTQRIVSDMQRLVDGGVARDKPECKLRTLMVGRLPFGVGEEGIETIAMGFKIIFPCLASFEPWEGG